MSRSRTKSVLTPQVSTRTLYPTGMPTALGFINIRLPNNEVIVVREANWFGEHPCTVRRVKATFRVPDDVFTRQTEEIFTYVFGP